MKTFNFNNIIDKLFSKTIFTLVLFICSYLSNALQIINSVVFPFVLIPWAAVLMYKTYENSNNSKIYKLYLLAFVAIYYAIIGVYHYLYRKAPIDSTFTVFWSIIIMFFVCYPNNTNDLSKIKSSIKIFSNGLILFASILSILGIYASISGKLIYISELHFVGIRPDMMRLYVFAYPNTIGVVCAYAILLSLFMLLNKKGIIKIAYILSILLNFITMALTQTRTALLILMGAIILYSFFQFYSLLSKTIKNNIGLTITSIAVSLAITVVIYLGHNAIVDMYAINLKNKQSSIENNYETTKYSIFNTAFAEEVKAEAKKDNTRIIVKDMATGFNNFSERTTIWKAGLNFIKNEPKVLITGTLTDHIMTKVNSYNYKTPKKMFESIHNSYLDILLIGGLPSFLLLALFFIKLLPGQFKLLFSNLKDSKNGYRIFPIIILSIAGFGLMESNLVYSISVVNVLLFVILGYSVFIANYYVSKKD